MAPDQLSSPYTQGTLQFEYDDMLYSLSGEFRRMPIKLSCEIKYYIDSYKDMLALIQQTVSKLAFIQTFNITYMGQLIKCSYKIPDSFGEEHTMDIDGSTTDSKLKTLTLSLEVESVFPVWNERTIVSSDLRISKVSFGGNEFHLQQGSTGSAGLGQTGGSGGGIKIYPPNGIQNNIHDYEIG